MKVSFSTHRLFRSTRRNVASHRIRQVLVLVTCSSSDGELTQAHLQHPWLWAGVGETAPRLPDAGLHQRRRSDSTREVPGSSAQGVKAEYLQPEFPAFRAGGELNESRWRAGPTIPRRGTFLPAPTPASMLMDGVTCPLRAGSVRSSGDMAQLLPATEEKRLSAVAFWGKRAVTVDPRRSSYLHELPWRDTFRRLVRHFHVDLLSKLWR